MEDSVTDSVGIFLKKIENILNEQKAQKARGLNDYNILTSVLKAGDEVRLHSGFIYSMINNGGTHYQESLFLKHFVQDALNNVPANFQTMSVFKEWQGGGENGGIDLFLTDGEYFFIIENKLYASDQYRQIARYINAVKKEYNLSKEQLKDKVYVYYLSPQGKKPQQMSLGKFQIKEENSVLKYDDYESKPPVRKHELELENELDEELKEVVVNFKLISYKKDIINWIESCLKETENLTKHF